MKKVSRVLWGDSVKFSSDPMFLFWPYLAHQPPNLMNLVCKEI